MMTRVEFPEGYTRSEVEGIGKGAIGLRSGTTTIG